MAEVVESGSSGYVLLGTSEVCLLSQWTATYDQATLTTVTHCSAGWQVTARGNKKMSGSITAKWHNTARLESISKTDSLVALELHMDSGRYWSGQARLGAIGHTVNKETGALQEVTLAFESHGTWTLN